MKSIFEATPLPDKLRKASERFFKEHDEEQACLITADGNIFFASCENLCITHMRLHNLRAWDVAKAKTTQKTKRKPNVDVQIPESNNQ